MPWLKGPPLCGQWSSMAKTSFSAVRNTAILPWGVFTQRAPRSGMSDMSPIGCQFISISSLRRLRVADRRHRLGLVSFLAGDAFRPGIDLGKGLAEDEALVIGLALLGIAHDLPADFFE